MNADPLTLSRIRRLLGGRAPLLLPVDRPQAAVALLLADTATGPDALFIVRAPHPGDPWAGNIGFPGGRMAAGETDPRQTAERETREELGLDLAGCEFIGRLDDLYGATLPILVSAFLYAAPSRPPMTPNHEVAAAFWVPLRELVDPARHRRETLVWRDSVTTQPVIDLLGADAPRLWGITYRLLQGFFRHTGLSFESGQS